MTIWKIIVALFCGFAPWIGALIGGYVVPWIASWLNIQMTYVEGMILSCIFWMMSQTLQADAKKNDVL